MKQFSCHQQADASLLLLVGEWEHRLWKPCHSVTNHWRLGIPPFKVRSARECPERWWQFTENVPLSDANSLSFVLSEPRG